MHRSLVLAAALALSWSAVPAAIEGPTGYVLVVGIIEDPDPIPLMSWEPAESGSLLAMRGVGRPDVSYSLSAGRPLVVWPYASGSQQDVAYTEWINGDWRYSRLLTMTAENDNDPRIFAEPNGTAHVVWWVSGAATPIRHLVRPAGSTLWSLPETWALPGNFPRRPSIAVHNGQLYVAYERTGAGQQEIVVARRTAGGGWTPTVVSTTSRTAPLDPTLHLRNGRLWLDWKHADGVVSYSRLDGSRWTPRSSVAWTDPSWFGEQDARDLVRAAVLGN